MKNLWQDVLVSYEKEYNELINVWSEVDRKSQNIISVSGIFIAAVFAFVKQISEEALLIEKLLVIIVLLSILITLGYCLKVLRIIYLPKPPYGDQLNEIVSDLSKVEKDELKKRATNYIHDKISLWKEVNHNIYDKLKTKTSHLIVAQIYLVFAITNMFLLTILILCNKME